MMFDAAKIKAVLWDLDDTLYSRVEAARLTFPGMFRTLLYPDRDEAFIREAVAYMMTQIRRNSMVHEDSFQALLKKFPPDRPYVRAQCLEYYYTYMHTFAKPFPEQLEIVKKLRACGIKNAIVTNITAELLASQQRKVASLGIAPFFDAIVYSGEFGIHKPDRRIYDHAAQLLGVPNSRCLFVGDDPDSDILGARNADMEAVWIDRWKTDDPFSEDPLVHRIDSILEYFQL